MLALADIYNTPMDRGTARAAHQRRRQPAARPMTFTGEAHRAFREALVARLHGAARVRGVDLTEIAQHSRLARLLLIS